MASPLQYTLPDGTGDDHPRIWARNKGQGTSDFLFPTVATLQARVAGSHIADYNALVSFAAARLGNAMSYFIGSGSSFSGRREGEYGVMFAFLARLKNFTGSIGSDTVDEYIDKANEIADALIGARSAVNAISNGSTRDEVQRQHGLMAAMIYTWNKPVLGSTRLNNLYNLIFDYVEQLHAPNDEEYLWGTAHGNIAFAMSQVIAILKDGTVSQDAETQGFLDTMLEAYDPGPPPVGQPQLGYWPIFRYFGNTDGGNHKGCGPNGYDTIQSLFYCRVFSAMRCGLQMDVFNTEPWFKKHPDWKLWHYRCDRVQHRTHENGADEAWSEFTQIHAYIAATLGADANEKNKFRWLAEEIADTGSGDIFGPFLIWRICCDARDPVSPVEPTLATANGGNVMKFFKNAGTTIWREGWGPGSISFKMVSEPFFTGDHQKRMNGSVELAHNGAPIFVQSGSYMRPLQSFTYKSLNSTGTTITPASETGHLATYCQRILASSVCRLFSTSEVTSNIQQSFQMRFVTSSGFGTKESDQTNPVISNDGGQLWKKNGSPQLSQPRHLGDIVGPVALAPFVNTPYPYPLPGGDPIETADYAYQATDLSGSYWSGKRTRYRRHILWIKNGEIPSWSRPIIMVWDDIESVIDGTAGNKSQVQQWQVCRTAPTGTPASVFTIARTAAPGSLFPFAPEMDAKCFLKLLSPSSASSAQINGFKDLNNVLYPAESSPGVFAGDDFDDTGNNVNGTNNIFRLELWPTTATTTPNFLVILCPRATGATYDLTTAVINNADKIGATINGVDVTINKGTTYGASVGGAGGSVPPALTDLVGAAGNARVDLQWSDSIDPTITKYRIYRSVKTAGVYGSFSQIAEITTGSPITSEYADTTAVNGTTYRYKVTVFNATGESADSNIVQELTPTAPPVFTGTVPWKTTRFTQRYKDTQQ